MLNRKISEEADIPEMRKHDVSVTDWIIREKGRSPVVILDKAVDERDSCSTPRPWRDVAAEGRVRIALLREEGRSYNVRQESSFPDCHRSLRCA